MIHRYTIEGTLGESDNLSPPVSRGEVVRELQFLNRVGKFNFGIDGLLDDMNRLGLVVTDIGFDLLILASLVYAADTRISRLLDSQDSWTREIKLVVPVSNKTMWDGVVPVLTQQLNFLTGDFWNISFKLRSEDINGYIHTEKNVTIENNFDCISLLSGGLDSLIGGINLLEQGSSPLFISHVGDPAISGSQERVYDSVREFYADRSLERIRLWMTFPSDLTGDTSSEKTTRSRSFLFFAVGIFVGMGLNKEFNLYASENGLISVNVPLDYLRLGSHSTHTTHPFYMARWNQLLSLLSISGKIVNPYGYLTKGEMVAQCLNTSLLSSLVPETISCSSPSKGRWKKVDAKHCGYCVPCLVRRAAILYGFGAGKDKTNYWIDDLDTKPLDTSRAVGVNVRSFQLAYARLTKDKSRAKSLVYVSGSLSDLGNKEVESLANMYVRGMNEVNNLLKGVVTKPLN